MTDHLFISIMNVLKSGPHQHGFCVCISERSGLSIRASVDSFAKCLRNISLTFIHKSANEGKFKISHKYIAVKEIKKN